MLAGDACPVAGGGAGVKICPKLSSLDPVALDEPDVLGDAECVCTLLGEYVDVCVEYPLRVVLWLFERDRLPVQVEVIEFVRLPVIVAVIEGDRLPVVERLFVAELGWLDDCDELCDMDPEPLEVPELEGAQISLTAPRRTPGKLPTSFHKPLIAADSVAFPPF